MKSLAYFNRKKFIKFTEILLSKAYILNIRYIEKIKKIKGNDKYERKKIYKIKSKYV